MAYLTQAQRRERALINFNDEFIHDLEKARKIINSYYRLSGLNYRVCIMQNDEATANSKYLEECEAKEQRWIKRLNSYLAPYKLHIVYAGIYPTITTINPERPTCIDREVYFYIG